MDSDPELEIDDSPVSNPDPADSVPMNSPPEVIENPASNPSSNSHEKTPSNHSVIIKSDHATEGTAMSPTRPHIKKQPKLPKGRPQTQVKPYTGIPILSPRSIGKETYDLDILQDPKMQREFQAGHRFQPKLPFDIPRSVSPHGDTDFIMRNIVSTRVKSPVKVKLSEGYLVGNSHRTVSLEPRQVDFKHLLEFGTQAELRREKLREERMKKEMSECSFRPKILPNSQSIRSSEEYYHYMLAHQQRVALKTQSQRDEIDSIFTKQAGTLFIPTICRYSRELVKETSEPRFEHLYKQHKVNLMKRMEAGDKEVLSTASTEDVSVVKQKNSSGKLGKTKNYAKSSEKTKLSKEIKEIEPEKKTNHESNLMLKERFLKEFREKWANLEPEKDEITYTKFTLLLTDLHFITNNPKSSSFTEERNLTLHAWSICNSLETLKTTKNAVEKFLLAVMNLAIYEDSNETKKNEIYTNFSQFYITRIGKFEKSEKREFREYYGLTFRPNINQFQRKNPGKIGDLMFSESEKRRAKLEKLREKVEKETFESLFSPTINTYPKDYVGVVGEYTQDTLSQYYVGMLKRGEMSRGEALYQLAAIAQERQKRGQRSSSDRENEGNMVECTFAPDRTLTKEIAGKGEMEEPKGMDKTVERLRKAREEEERRKGMKERGYVQMDTEPVRFTVEHKHKLQPVFDLRKANEKMVGNPEKPRVSRVIRGKVVLSPTPPPSLASPLVTAPTNLDTPVPGINLQPVTIDTDPPLPTAEPLPADPVPVTETTEPPPKPEPLLSVGVAVREGVTDDLIIYSPDDIQSAVQSFSLKHGLPADHAARLIELLEFQIAEQGQ